MHSWHATESRKVAKLHHTLLLLLLLQQLGFAPAPAGHDLHSQV
jgi:hypothetical protein